MIRLTTYNILYYKVYLYLFIGEANFLLQALMAPEYWEALE